MIILNRIAYRPKTVVRMSPKKSSSEWDSAKRSKNSIKEKLEQGFDPETDGDDIYEQIEDIDPEELLNDFSTTDDDDDLY